MARDDSQRDMRARVKVGAVGKKSIMQTEHEESRRLLMHVSKAALADLVIDLLRQRDGEALDASALADGIRASLEPILIARQDRSLP